MQDTVLETDTEFWISVCCEFNVKQQLQSLIAILQYLAKLPANKEGNDRINSFHTSALIQLSKNIWNSSVILFASIFLSTILSETSIIYWCF